MKGNLFKVAVVLATFACTFAIAMSQVFNPANGHYYQVVFESKPWHEARDIANSMSHEGMPGHLVTIESEQETNFLVDNVLDAAHSYWTAGIQPLGAGEPNDKWNWADRGPMQYSNWAGGEPNNSSFREDAVELYSNGEWNDSYAGYDFYFVVEFEPPSLFWQAEGNYYFVPDLALTQSQAQEYANTIWKYGYQGHVASLTSQSENDFVYDAFPGETGDNYFIGGFQPDGSGEPGEGWSWLSGEEWSYTNWAPGEPNNFGDEKILVLRADGQWNDSSDTDEFRSIVELDLGHEISGQLFLISYDDYLPVGIEFEFRETGTLNVVHTAIVMLDSESRFRTSGPREPGVYDVSVKAHTWLRDTVTVDLTSGQQENVGIVLINGDCDGDNEINLVDFAIVSASFGLSRSDAGFDFFADLNADGEVNLVDFGIVSAFFGLTGDE